MPFKGVLISFVMILLGVDEIDKTYHKYYYDSGQLKSQGWKKGKVRTDYWFFYRKNGTIEKEGHYRDGKMADWWLFYDETGVLNHKCQLSGGKKNGYCLKYMDDKLTSAVKYSKGKRIKEWHDLKSFKKENKLSDLK